MKPPIMTSFWHRSGLPPSSVALLAVETNHNVSVHFWNSQCCEWKLKLGHYKKTGGYPGQYLLKTVKISIFVQFFIPFVIISFWSLLIPSKTFLHSWNFLYEMKNYGKVSDKVLLRTDVMGDFNIHRTKYF